MKRRLVFLLIISSLLLVGSVAGDILLLHHHLTGLALDDHYRSSLSTAFLSSLVLVLSWYVAPVLFGALRPDIPGAFDTITRHFCGWHSSAYLGRLIIVESIDPGPLKVPGQCI